MRSETKSSLERIFHQLSKHPFLSVTVACVLAYFFSFSRRESMTAGNYIYACILALIAYTLLFFIGRVGSTKKETLIITLTAAIFTAGGLFLMRSYQNSPALFMWMSLFVIAALCALMRVTDTLSDRNFIILLVAAGIIMRLSYDLYTSTFDRQYDVGGFNWNYGHANYIEHWYKNGLKLPDKDQIMIWQYYHPPLHHWLMALLLRILTVCGMEYDKACQSLQILPMLYSSLIMVVCYRIFRFVNLRRLPLVIAMTIICFHPAFLHLGSSFNNDVLSVLFMMLSVMFALRWYREPTLKRILPIALCIGLGMMTKLSAWMVAPAIAVLFLYVFVKNIKSWAKFLGQFTLFGLICAPMGLWWQIRSLIAFDMPITYVPYGNVASAQYCGDMTAAKRLFDFGNGQLSFVYVAYSDPAFNAKFCDYNPTIGLFKTAMFSEGVNNISDIHFPQIAKTGPILFWIGVVLGLLCFVSFIVMMLSKKSGLDGMTRVFFSVMALTFLGSYYAFCFQFPFTCTMNIRYCVPLIPLFVMGLGLMLKRFGGAGRGEKLFRGAVCVLTVAFVVMTCLVYAQVSFPKA